MKKSIPMIAAAAFVFGTAALIIKKLLEQPLDTVPKVDLNRYLGRWYEIAAIPQRFEKGCTYTTAQYSLNDDGTIAIKNSCISKGIQRTAIGKASISDPVSNAKLNVSFFWPFSGKYWIIDLASDYSYAMVGHPNRKYLWILSRKPWMEKETYKELLISAMSKGFDISKLKITPQKSGD
ncbi:lipocalin family protein [Arcticibacter tournemirensis]|uniref:Lipocalin/cytosolic fatty-acid binding domain-containing protein n=1 Tax=Arcticibacter tournemirensis TaxID=699437 RepID=A0A4Q0MFR7_9SPHI|nr:lipocalin family protein [Arcticibacter tournemirensis]RXF71809.1 hypothetical protein EKH83_03735 [Arcticibacter tournemirensis]